MAVNLEELNLDMHTRNGIMTREEYCDLHEQLHAADARGDSEEFDRILRLVPLVPHVAKAAKEVFGKEFLISAGFDLTEATMQYGEGWLDE